MATLLFSDECGKWSGEDDQLYCRAWLALPKRHYSGLKRISSNLRGAQSELHWSQSGSYRTKNPLRILPNEASIYISFAVLEEFRNTNYQIIQQIRDIDYSSLRQLDNSSSGELTSALETSAKKKIFLHYYERHSFMNALKFLSIGPRAAIEVDKPQFTEQEFIGMCKDASGQNVQVVNSKDSAGVQFCDLIAGAASDVIVGSQSRRGKEAGQFFQRCFSAHLARCFNNGKQVPNPNKIFWNTGDISNEFVTRAQSLWLQ